MIFANESHFFAPSDAFLCNFCLPLARSLREGQIEVVMMSPLGDRISHFQNEGFRWVPLPMKRSSLNPLRELFVLRSIYAVFKQEAPDAVHSFNIKAVVYGRLGSSSSTGEKENSCCHRDGVCVQQFFVKSQFPPSNCQSIAQAGIAGQTKPLDIAKAI